MRTSKLKNRFFFLMIIGILTFTAFYAARIWQLNERYPSAQIIAGTQNTPITWNGLNIKLLNGELVSQESFFSTYEVDASSIFSDSSADQYALFSISVTKLEEKESQNHF